MPEKDEDIEALFRSLGEVVQKPLLLNWQVSQDSVEALRVILAIARMVILITYDPVDGAARNGLNEILSHHTPDEWMELIESYVAASDHLLFHFENPGADCEDDDELS